jgi:hypothetical protein
MALGIKPQRKLILATAFHLDTPARSQELQDFMLIDRTCHLGLDIQVIRDVL